KLPDAIRGLISEIYWNPTDGNKNKIMLYMNDGFVVDGVIRRFADRMELIHPLFLSWIQKQEELFISVLVLILKLLRPMRKKWKRTRQTARINRNHFCKTKGKCHIL